MQEQGSCHMNPTPLDHQTVITLFRMLTTAHGQESQAYFKNRDSQMATLANIATVHAPGWSPHRHVRIPKNIHFTFLRESYWYTNLAYNSVQ